MPSRGTPRRCVALPVACLALGLTIGGPRARAAGLSSVFLNGVATTVSFNDGDSFRVRDGQFAGTQCRLSGFNTLESFGPVHQWGGFHPYELFTLAKRATQNGAAGRWHCSTSGERDGYGRLLVDCPDLAMDQIREGLALAMQVDDTPARPEYLRAQAQAIAERRGIWAHGAPEFVLTSLHSAAEDPDRPSHYNRLVSTRDGHSEKMEHRDTYAECQWVCHEETAAHPADLRRAARALRADPTVARHVAPFANLHLEEFASRYIRLGTLPEYLTGEARAAVEGRLSALRASGALGAPTRRPGACMLYVEFTRHYGRDRAACLRGRGAPPPAGARSR